jgi:hypothetical protein
MKSLADDKFVFDSAECMDRNQSVDSVDPRREVSALWQRLLLDVDYYVQLRTKRSYEIAVEKLARLRSLAILTSDTTTFNDELSRIRKRHQTKSLLMSMLNRSVNLI